MEESKKYPRQWWHIAVLQAAAGSSRACTPLPRPSQHPAQHPPAFRSWSAYSITMNTASREGPTTTSLTFTMCGWSRLVRRQGRMGSVTTGSALSCGNRNVGYHSSVSPCAIFFVVDMTPSPATEHGRVATHHTTWPGAPQQDVDLADGGQREAVPLLLQLHLFERADLARLAIARAARRARGGVDNEDSGRGGR